MWTTQAPCEVPSPRVGGLAGALFHPEARVSNVSVTKDDITQGLRRIGIGPGSVLVVHSSLRSFGHVTGGAEAVITALQETVTRRGLVIMPVHSNSLAGRRGVRPFDPETSPGETGRIPEVFRHQPGVLRSRHPTHSVAAWGHRATELIADHERRSPVGRDSPLHKAAQWGGQILQFGVGHGSNTTLHLAEVLAGVPYLQVPYRRDWGKTALVRRPDGSVEEVGMVNGEQPACSVGFVAIEPLLEQHGLTREMRIGRSRVRLTPTQAMLRVAVEALRRDPTFLLCDRRECEHCTRARELCAKAGNRTAAGGSAANVEREVS